MNYVHYDAYGKAVPVLPSRSSRELTSAQRDKLVTKAISKLVRGELKTSPSMIAEAIHIGNDFDKINLGVVELASGVAVTNANTLTSWLNDVVVTACKNYTYDHPQMLAIARAMILHPFRERLNGCSEGVVVIGAAAVESNLAVLVPLIARELLRSSANCPVLDFSELHVDYLGNKPIKGEGISLQILPSLSSTKLESKYSIGIDAKGYFCQIDGNESRALSCDTEAITINCQVSTLTRLGQLKHGFLKIVVLSGGELGTLVGSSVPIPYDSNLSAQLGKDDDPTFRVFQNIHSTRCGVRGYSYLCLDNQLLETTMFISDTLLNKVSTEDLAIAVTTGRGDKLPALVKRMNDTNPFFIARILQMRYFVEKEENFTDTARFIAKYGSIGKLFRKHMSFDSFNNIKSKISYIVNYVAADNRSNYPSLGLTHGKLVMRNAIDFVGGKSLISRSYALLDLVHFGEANSSNLDETIYKGSQYAMLVDQEFNKYLASCEKYSERESIKVLISHLEGKHFISFFLFSPSFSL